MKWLARETVMVLGTFIAGALFALAVVDYRRSPPSPPPPPAVPAIARPTVGVDARFTAIGRDFGPALLGVFAAAHDDGAKALDDGLELPAAVARIGERWKTGRATLYSERVGVELARIVPERTDPAAVTPAQKAAMAAAWRGLARGLAP